MYTVREKTEPHLLSPLHVAAAWALPSKPLVKLKTKEQLVSFRNLKQSGPRWTPAVPAWVDQQSLSFFPLIVRVSHKITVSSCSEEKGCPQAQAMEIMLEVMSEKFNLTN